MKKKFNLKLILEKLDKIKNNDLYWIIYYKGFIINKENYRIKFNILKLKNHIVDNKIQI